MVSNQRFTRTVAVPFKLSRCPNQQDRLSFSTIYWLNVLYIKCSSFWREIRISFAKTPAWPCLCHVLLEARRLQLSFPCCKCGRAVDLMSCISTQDFWLLCSFSIGGNIEPNLTFHFLYDFCVQKWNAKWKMSVSKKLFFWFLISVGSQTL